MCICQYLCVCVCRLSSIGRKYCQPIVGQCDITYGISFDQWYRYTDETISRDRPGEVMLIIMILLMIAVVHWLIALLALSMCVGIAILSLSVSLWSHRSRFFMNYYQYFVLLSLLRQHIDIAVIKGDYHWIYDWGRNCVTWLHRDCGEMFPAKRQFH